MTYTNTNPLSDAEQKRLICVENDVKKAMKEACKPYDAETKEALRQRRSRVLLASQLGKLILALSVMFISACSWKVEAAYFGQTALDDRHFTAEEKPLQNPKGKY